MPGSCRETEVCQLIHGWSISCDNSNNNREVREECSRDVWEQQDIG